MPTAPQPAHSHYKSFDPEQHAETLVPMLEELRRLDRLDGSTYNQLVRRYPRQGGGSYSKSELIRAYRRFAPRFGWQDGQAFIARLRMKPIRTLSGVAPVTVLTKPFPCPGKCIFCPSDVRMPKSYLSREPGAQRAAQHRFDPYGQTMGRLLTYHHNGHLVDKVELIVLGGTWSSYPESYQVWFILRCFEAMNDFRAEFAEQLPHDLRGNIDFEQLEEEVDGASLTRSYNEVVRGFLRDRLGGRLVEEGESATWSQLEQAHRENERAEARCVGLVLETRPDHVTPKEVVRLRRLGATKIQIGIQTLDDEILARNGRGHDVAASRRSLALLRGAGFKLHVHWMPNLLGASPESDAVDFQRLFDDSEIRPDELKVYPCSLIETAELMRFYQSGEWRPYEREELAELLEGCLLSVPEYCRVTRVIRDIPGDDIVDGNKTTNFRQVVEQRLEKQGQSSRDIRAREIRRGRVDPSELELVAHVYSTSVGEEHFLQFVTPDDRLAGFCRLSLPTKPADIDEIRHAAMIREVHVYGGVSAIGDDPESALGGRTQHRGLGRRLVEEAAGRARAAGFSSLAVISAIGTRDYYRRLGFGDRSLYQVRELESDQAPRDL